MRRPVRTLAILGTLVLAALGLAACQEPAPKVTVQTGSFSTTISPSTYCFDSNHCRRSSSVDLPVVTTGAPDDKVLIDVPRAVAGTGWAVEALTLDGHKALGGSGTLHAQHTYRVAGSANGGQPFVVAIDQVRHGKPDGSRWSFLVKVSNA